MRRLVREATKRIVPGQSRDSSATEGWRLRWGVLRKNPTRMKLSPAKGRQILCIVLICCRIGIAELM
jgi:hypothetical protein